MARQDIHRPAAIEPADYSFVAFDYLPTSPGDLGAAMFLADERARKREHMARTGGRYSGHEHGGLCHICGSVNAIYSATFYHAKSNAYIRTGLDCASKLECRGIEAFRKNVKAAKEANAGKRKAKAVLEAAGLSKAWEIFEAHVKKCDDYAAACKAWNEANPKPEYQSSDGGYGIETVGAPKFEQPGRDENTVLDIVSRLIKWGNISDKAANFLGILLKRIEKAPEIAAARAAEADAAKPVPVFNGRATIKGKVLTIREPDDYAQFPARKMLVQHADGWKVWGTLPSAISDVERGDEIEFVATITVSDKDPKFGFASRPSKAKVLKALAA